MFTGIVHERGSVVRSLPSNTGLDVKIRAPGVAKELRKGDSVAIDGICFTVTKARGSRFWVHAVEETLVTTTIGGIEKGSRVNLELPARVFDRLGGHLVQGHVDGIARVVGIDEQEDGGRGVWLQADEGLLRYVASKGSVTLDGVSLTVVEVRGDSFQVALIPHTLEETTLRDWVLGSEVNLEVDVIAKYVERLMERTGP